jgi:hypothetical protein
MTSGDVTAPATEEVVHIWAGLVISCAACLVACATPHSDEQIDAMLAQAVISAESLLEREQPVEAAQLVSAAARVDPTHPRLAEIQARIAAQGAKLDLFAPTLLGSNRARRYPVKRSIFTRAALYVPDRVIDLLDCFTLDVTVGPSAFLKTHVTRGLQLGGGLRGVVGIGTYSHRSVLGGSAWSGVELAVGPTGLGAEGALIASAAGVSSGAQAIAASLRRPSDAYYQEFDDYWSVGATWGLAVIGGNWWLHPAQLADFVAGFAGIDFLNDDLAGTRGLALSRSEEALVIDLSRVARVRATEKRRAEPTAASE